MKTLALFTLSLAVGLPACEKRAVDRSGALCTELQAAIEKPDSPGWSPASDLLIAAPYAIRERTVELKYVAASDHQYLIESSNGQENVLVVSLIGGRIQATCYLDERFSVSPSVLFVKCGQEITTERQQREWRPLIVKLRDGDAQSGDKSR